MIGMSEFEIKLDEELSKIRKLLVEKNSKYGDSALNPSRIFSKANPIEQINIRIDDKLSRIRTQHEGEDEDVEIDLIGYLVLKQIAKKSQK
jgi:hypothetical protein